MDQASGGRAMHRTILAFSGAVLVLCAPARAAPDYAKRLQALEPALKTRLLGRWTNPVDGLVSEISSIDLASGQIRGTVSPTSGPAAANEHELGGRARAGAQEETYDNVVPLTWRTPTHEHGSRPVGGGRPRGGR